MSPGGAGSRGKFFSDGVFRHHHYVTGAGDSSAGGGAGGNWRRKILKAWPAYLSYALAFLYVGIIWLNHHAVFQYIRKVNMTVNLHQPWRIGAGGVDSVPDRRNGGCIFEWATWRMKKAAVVAVWPWSPGWMSAGVVAGVPISAAGTRKLLQPGVDDANPSGHK